MDLKDRARSGAIHQNPERERRAAGERSVDPARDPSLPLGVLPENSAPMKSDSMGNGTSVIEDSGESPPAPASLAARLGKARIAVRDDLEVSRHVFRGEPAYVIRDPMTFQSHRLSVSDYAVFSSIDSSCTLGEVFEALAGRGIVHRQDAESFYKFVVTLHRLNFLRVPISDDQALYQRHVTKQRLRRRQWVLGFLSLRLPLFNPDEFLGRTMGYARFLFRPWFFALWCVMVGSAAVVGVQMRDRLVEPVEGLLAAGNVALMAGVLVVLKAIHEFGHAYACKHLGGRVPEMGAYLILFTPCAYVDASAAWGFTRRRDRIIVSLAGMYVEAAVAAVAMWVWVATDGGLVHDVAYNVIFLAGVVTVVFNVNPLMRYDGYYVLCDLLGIPNLRQRSTRRLLDLVKRWVLGVSGTEDLPARGERVTLVIYGLASSLWRAVVIVGICAAVAAKMFWVGMTLAVVLGVSLVYQFLRRTLGYLWFARETEGVRLRSAAVSVVALASIGILVLGVPVRSTVEAAGVFRTEQETIVRAGVDGVVQRPVFQLGEAIGAGEVLVALSNPAYDDAVTEASARVEASEITENAYRPSDPGRANQEQARGAAARTKLMWRREEAAKLVVRAPEAGDVVEGIGSRDVGRFVRRGEPLATLARGRWLLRAILKESDLADARPAVGDEVEVRTASAPETTMRGVVRQVAPGGSRNISERAFTHLGGGEVAVNPATGAARQAYFEITVDLGESPGPWLRSGSTGRVRLAASRDPLGLVIYRGLMRFVNTLMQR